MRQVTSTFLSSTCPLPTHSPCMDWTRFLTVSGRTLSAAHFSMSCGGMWLYASRLSTVSGSSCIESMNWLWGQQDSVGADPSSYT